MSYNSVTGIVRDLVTKPPSESPIRAAHTRATEEGSRLSEAVKRLVDRLSPVLRSSSQSRLGDTPECRPTGATDVAEQFLQHADVMASAAETIEDLIARCDL